MKLKVKKHTETVEDIEASASIETTDEALGALVDAHPSDGQEVLDLQAVRARKQGR